MTIAAIREKLHDYINIADDEKVKAIYILVEEQITPAYDWAQDKEFVAELDERVRRYETGIDRSYTIDEVRRSMKEWKKDFKENLNK